MPEAKCFYCDNPATRYCDFALGGPIAGYERVGNIEDNRFYACFDVDQMPYTCDMPMCEEHATQVGSVHICGKASGHETIDHCPEHRGKREFPCPCSEEEADTLRRAVRAQANRTKMRVVAESRETIPKLTHEPAD